MFPPAALVVLCLASTVTNLGNRFAQDDMPVIEKNPVVHTLAHPTTFFTESYWPKPFPPALYRPLSTTFFAVQWVAGGGRPWVFRATSIILYGATGLLLYRLALTLLPAAAAWLVAAFFMVHPVHVEAVAVGVNQSEVAVGLFAVAAVALYLAVRRRQALRSRDGVLLFALYLAAALSKESGLMVMGLIVAAEVILVRDDRPIGRRLADIRPMILVMLLGAAIFFAARTAALGGDPVGTFTAEALAGQGIGGRALTMLGVVPHWFRLLLWPAHLRGDYSPREIEAAAGFGLPQVQGALLVLLTVMVLVACWKKHPVVSFGLAWAAIGIFPVSNVLVPTGIVLAERTLFLPSIGMMLAVGALAVPVIERLKTAAPALRLAAAGGVAAVLVMGTTRSASRQRVWQDQFTFWHQTTIDAPQSYRAHHALAQLLFQIGVRRWAEQEYRLAIELYPSQWGAYFDLANKLRLTGLCEPAIRYYRQTLLIEPEQENARTSLIACLLHLARYQEAKSELREGLAYASRPARVKYFQSLLRVTDSAITVKAAPGTVKLSVEARDTLP